MLVSRYDWGWSRTDMDLSVVFVEIDGKLVISRLNEFAFNFCKRSRTYGPSLEYPRPNQVQI